MANECPTGRYADEIVTAGGLTLKNPTTVDRGLGGALDWSGSELDFAEWDALAMVLAGRREHAWRKLKECPGTASMPPEEYNALVGPLNDVRDRYARIRKPWTSGESAYGTTGWTWGISLPDFAVFDASQEIGLLTGLIVDSQCLRQKIDAAITKMGCSPDSPGDTGHAPPSEGLGFIGKIGLVAGAIAIPVGVVLIVRKVMS